MQVIITVYLHSFNQDSSDCAPEATKRKRRKLHGQECNMFYEKTIKIASISLLRKVLRRQNFKMQSLKTTLESYCCSAHPSVPGDLNHDTSKNPELISDKPWPDSSALYIHTLSLYFPQITKNQYILVLCNICCCVFLDNERAVKNEHKDTAQ